MLMSRETTSAMYITPAKDSSITSERARGVTGRMSLSPTLDSTATLRYSSSIQLRIAAGSDGMLKLPGTMAWHTTYTYANAQARRVNVAPAAKSSSVVATQSWSMYAIRLPVA